LAAYCFLPKQQKLFSPTIKHIRDASGLKRKNNKKTATQQTRLDALGALSERIAQTPNYK
jgi:hypothetical protein